MGGRIALHAALAPALESRVLRRVLIGASPGIADPAERASGAPPMSSSPLSYAA